MREVIGIDSYNLCTTGGVSKTLQAERADNEHLAIVLIGEENESKSIWLRPGGNERGGIVIVISKDNGTADGENVGRVLRSGCIHGYVHNGE